ncbi:MAG: hypothetical protein AAB288_04530, partial [Acidobacteriota bacterium]
MNPKKADELEGARFAFAQGGQGGFKLVHLTPPVSIVLHKDRCEARWKPAEMPFTYAAAPLLLNNEGNTDIPALREFLKNVDRSTWNGRFSSVF